MRKLLLVCSLVLLFVSCSKDEVSVTSYQVFNNSSVYNSSLDASLNGSMYEVVVYCYAGSDIVRQDNYDKIAVGAKTPIKTVTDAVTKIKISYKSLPSTSTNYSLVTRSYVVAYTLIEVGKNVIAEVNDESMVGKSLAPKTTSEIVPLKVARLK